MSARNSATADQARVLLDYEFNGYRSFGDTDTLDGAQHFLSAAGALTDAVSFGCMAPDGFDNANIEIQTAAFRGITALIALASFSIDQARRRK